MVQGKMKNLQKSTGNSRAAKKAAANPKKGKRAIAPKKEALVKQAKMHQNLSAKINKTIEQQVVNAASSGKLTIMKNIASDREPTSSKPKPKKK